MLLFHTFEGNWFELLATVLLPETKQARNKNIICNQITQPYQNCLLDPRASEDRICLEPSNLLLVSPRLHFGLRSSVLWNYIAELCQCTIQIGSCWSSQGHAEINVGLEEDIFQEFQNICHWSFPHFMKKRGAIFVRQTCLQPGMKCSGRILMTKRSNPQKTHVDSFRNAMNVLFGFISFLSSPLSKRCCSNQDCTMLGQQLGHRN